MAAENPSPSPRDLTALAYARTQLGAIAHYLRLIFWPTGLTLSLVDWPRAKNWSDIPPGGYVVAALALLTLIALWKKPRLGFVGAWFFFILAPSSSFIPIITEVVPNIASISHWPRHRAGGHRRLDAGKATQPGTPRSRWRGAIAIALIVLTIKRNFQYQTAVAIWSDNVDSRPNNAQAQYDLGYAWAELDWAAPRGSPAQNSPPPTPPPIWAALQLNPRWKLPSFRGI